MEFQINPNSFNKDGWTPLHMAVRKGQWRAVEMAIEHNKLNESV